MSKSVTIAGIETSLCSHAEALEVADSHIGSFLKKQRPDILLLPEKWILEKYDEVGGNLEQILDVFRNLSSRYRATIVPGSYSVVRGEKLFNSAPVIVEGEVQGWSDKISLFRRELDNYASGSEIKVFKTGSLVFGVPVCYDLDFPYYSKMAVGMGARFLLNPSLIPKQFHKMWHIYVRGRSLENRLPVISINASSEPLAGGSIATSMQEADGGVLLQESRPKGHTLLLEFDYESTSELIERRRLEDPGKYSLH